tara:strand:+ start:274 stop:981 length:708 start_codon:yes stop_codon:yes gene_type:complete
MAKNEVTLDQLIARSRRRADQENSDFCTDAEIVDYINEAIAELHEMLVNEYELYYVSSEAYTLPAANPGTLPDDFWKALGCDFASGGVTRRIRRYMFQERNAYESPMLKQGYMANVFFIIEGNNIRFIPESPPGGTVTLWYIEEPQKFVGDEAGEAAKLFSVDRALANGFERFIILDAAIKMLQKEESDTQILMVEREGVRQRLMVAGKDRVPGESRAIADVMVGTAARSYVNWI